MQQHSSVIISGRMTVDADSPSWVAFGPMARSVVAVSVCHIRRLFRTCTLARAFRGSNLAGGLGDGNPPVTPRLLP